MTSGSTGSTFPKWQLAVLLGAPIAIGLGYLYWRRQSSEDITNDKSGKKKISDSRSISIDGDDKDKLSKIQNGSVESEAKELTPLELAQKHKNEGNKCFKAGKYDEAIEHYDKAIETCPLTNSIDLSTFFQNRAAAYEQLKKWHSVKDDCTKALELNSKYVKALQRRARAYEQIKELANSLNDITATCIIEGFQNRSTLIIADRVLKELGSEHAKEAMKNRKEVIPSKNFIKNYFASFAQDPIKKIVIASSEAKGFVLAKMALDAQNFDDIIPACTEEINGNGDYKNEATLLRSTFYLLTGRFKEALVDLDTLINNKDIDNKLISNALIKRASLNIQMQNPEKCFEDFDQAEQLDPDNSDIYHHRGQIFTLLEKMEDALINFEKATKLAPDQGITYVHKCYAEYRIAFMTQNQMKLMSVMNDFSTAIEKFPTCVECYSLMAQVLTDQQQFEQADSYFEKAIKIDPQNATLIVHRGLLQLQWTADVNKALEIINQAIELDSKCEFAYETLGTIEVQRGQLDKAVDLFDKALNLAKSEMEMIHICSLKAAATAQIHVTKQMGVDMNSLSALAAGGL